MNTVEPIKNLDDIKLIKQELLKTGYRNYLLFVLGCNSGLRVSDLLTLTVGQVRGGRVSIKEQKTGKAKTFPLNTACMEALKSYIENMADNEYLFASRKGGAPITRIQAYRILNKACKSAGLENTVIGTHTLRKTFGYHHYRQNKDVAFLMTVFQHSSPSITLRYIGIQQEEIDNYYHEVNL